MMSVAALVAYFVVVGAVLSRVSWRGVVAVAVGAVLCAWFGFSFGYVDGVHQTAARLESIAENRHVLVMPNGVVVWVWSARSADAARVYEDIAFGRAGWICATC